MTASSLEAYCVRCRAKRPLQNPEPIFLSNGRAATRGTCPECGATLVRMGRTPAHEGLTPPPTPAPANKPKTRKRASGASKGAAEAAGKGTKLVIVESPAKARTIGRYLGKGYLVKASIGHVRDLLRSRMAVDVENDFKPTYRVPKEKRQVVKEIAQLAKKADEIYIATDPDREGEAIAWHLVEAAKLDPAKVRRVVFHEITKPAVQEAFAHPRDIDMNLVNAQQARRILDRLVGYSLSPLLWKKVRSRLSAGRVQSVALRLVVEREREIQAFVPQEYWTIDAEFQPEGVEARYRARLVKVDGQDPELPNEEAVRPLLKDLEQATYVAVKVKTGQRRRRPAAPFTTSTLQQEASRKLGFSARQTMVIAQQLYEGLDVGEGGNTGLITYMRTDSTNVSVLAQQEARRFIQERFGEDYLPPKPPQYKTRAKRAQEAHEAIRPTSVFRTPEKVKPYLTREQFLLYQLIWQRFVASQMTPAVYDTISVEVEGKGQAHTYLFRASGSRLRFPGYLVVYEEARDEDAQETREQMLPEGIREGQRQLLQALYPEQHFTQPPPRYTDATLIRTLEEYGIGRPSTYAPILSTLLDRGYVRRENRRLVPTETGMLVSDLLVKHFPDIMDVGFTARMEEDLDRIAAGEREWVEVLREFYGPFREQVRKAEAAMPEHKTFEKVGRDCPQCGGELIIRWGRYGKFISCSNFPQCRYTEPYVEKTGAKCPRCGGDLIVRRTRKGRVFYGCSNYPECDFTTWKRPLPAPCPSCGGLLVQANRREAQCLQCETRFPLEEVETPAEAAAETTPSSP